MKRLTILLLALVGCAHSASGPADARSADQGVLVVGTGHASATPDLAVLRLGVEVRRPTVLEAREAAAAAQTRLLEALRANGVAEERIRTEGLQVQPDFEYSDSGRHLRGYVVSHTVVVRLAVDDRLGPAVDAAITAAGDEVRFDGLQLVLDDPTEARARAREAAVADARRAAEELARLAGVTLGDPIVIEETAVNGGGPMPMPIAMRMTADAATPVSTGEIQTEVQVRVRFALGG
ncbi:MAG: SIMPL domain-containing protein [Sandaracinus sp.]|nr:SIMPL domain-containing protein [Sandaracinus sp.]